MPDLEWFYEILGDTVGPFSTADFRRLIATGQIRAETRIRMGRDTEWVTALSIPGLFTPSEAEQENDEEVAAEALGLDDSTNVGPRSHSNDRLTNCPDCGESVSKLAATCPHCGALTCKAGRVSSGARVQSATAMASPQAARTDIFAVLSLGAGLTLIIGFPILFGPLAIFFAIVSLYRQLENRTLKGKGISIFGALLGVLGTAWATFLLLW